MLDKLLSYLFRCTHNHRGFPVTRKNIMYIVCLDCGAEFKYNWDTMSISKLSPLERKRLNEHLQANQNKLSYSKDFQPSEDKVIES